MKKIILLFTACFALCLMGCQNPVNTVDQSGSRVINDGFLNSRLLIEEIKVVESEGAFTTAQFTIKSARYGWFAQTWSWLTGDNPYKVEYKISWFDKNGRYIQTATSTWIQVNLWPGEVKYIQSTAPTPECKDFKVQVKELN